ncbi:MAG: peptidylprolyl isomerase [Paludisphaera borealis]|uniref:peptidylprolyl isomerase n=1 Tax=Paludisphaera borealis TaxID=1387353 RepID=UPI00284BB70B|nr:peptidylprolyl isomerase [Paludisphaera borealis]MDR3618671.1 peptidylprolyl isomerase [Paludisphaera borealis]
MIAKDRGRKAKALVVGLTLLGGAATAQAQQTTGKTRVGAAKTAPAGGQAAETKVRLDQITDVPGLKETAVPVNPTDAIAIVNGQIISRQQLADECVARKGKEILETLINRQIVDQALKARKLDITAAEIDAEIDNVASRFGIGREAWLRTLDKERGISPLQYARDIIYPALALRKLCTGRVQVTPDDLKKAFEAQYGDKLRCRIIMVDKITKAQDIWEALRKNPGGFEKIAQEQSMDLGTRSLGGLLSEPITRHAHPANVADAAFAQLVDGDPNDKDPNHKPKNGEVTGPIQASESTWVLLRREDVIPAVANVSLKDENIRKKTYEIIYEVKLKEEMGVVFEQLIKQAAIENKLVGSIQMANEENDPDFRVDKDVKLMSNAAEGVPASAGKAQAAAAAGTAPAKAKLPRPAALSADAGAQFDKGHLTPAKTPAAPSAVTPTPGSPN